MDFADEHSFEDFGSQVTRFSGLASLGRGFLSVLCSAFQSETTALNLSARLRRDAGLDEYELEETRMKRAPLIR
ncbi:hypothetical protein [Ruegeria hyattellae]|uniref:hypothetical protein n=1 Tax=Ruegeria hyattellae TaxID=3233337 RepID=UPI00355C1031